MNLIETARTDGFQTSDTRFQAFINTQLQQPVSMVWHQDPRQQLVLSEGQLRFEALGDSASYTKLREQGLSA